MTSEFVQQAIDLLRLIAEAAREKDDEPMAALFDEMADCFADGDGAGAYMAKRRMDHLLESRAADA